MKNKLVLVFFIILTFFGFGCNLFSKETIEIKCDEQVVIYEYLDIEVFIDDEKVEMNRIGISLSDYNVAEIIDGKLYGKEYGTVIMTVMDLKDNTKYTAKTIEVVRPSVSDIIITGKNELFEDKTIQLTAEVIPSLITTEVTWSSSNTNVITVDDGLVTAVGVGSAKVIVTCEDFVKEFSIIVNPTPTFIVIEGKSNILVNEVVTFSYNIEEDVVLESSDENIVKVYDGAIVGISSGTATITAKKVSNNNVQGTIEIIVEDKVNELGATDEEKAIIDEIISGMSTEQMIGEMFNIEFASNINRWSGGFRVTVQNSTGLPFAALNSNTGDRTVAEYMGDYKFGNFTISAVSGQNPVYIQNAAKTLKEYGINNTGITPYISINYQNGYEMKGMSVMPGNMQMAAVGNTQIITEVNDAYAKQLQYYGINSITNAYLNNNVSIVWLSDTYGNDIDRAVATAKIVSQTLQKNGVAMIPDMSQQDHWGDTRTEEEIYSKDYRLMESAINSGTSIIILPALYYSYLEDAAVMSIFSETFMKEYIREKLGYQGVLMLDNNSMSNLYSEGNMNEAVLSAINNGIDMLGYTITFDTSASSTYRNRAQALFNLYDYLVSAANNGTLSNERLKEAVSRIILSKIRNNIFEETQEINLEETQEIISKYGPNFITVVGDMGSFDPEEKVLFISERYSETGTTSSIGDCFGSYFAKLGYSEYKVMHTNTLYPSIVSTEASIYDKVYICVSEVSSSTSIGVGSSGNFIKFVNDVKAANPNTCIIFTGEVEYKDSFPEIDNFIVLNGFYEQTFDSLFKVLAGRAKPNNNLLY